MAGRSEHGRTDQRTNLGIFFRLAGGILLQLGNLCLQLLVGIVCVLGALLGLVLLGHGAGGWRRGRRLWQWLVVAVVVDRGGRGARAVGEGLRGDLGHGDGEMDGKTRV